MQSAVAGGARREVLEEVSLNDNPPTTHPEPHLHPHTTSTGTGTGPALVFSNETLSSSEDEEETDDRTILFERGAGRAASPTNSSSSTPTSNRHHNNNDDEEHRDNRRQDEEGHSRRDEDNRRRRGSSNEEGIDVVLVECPVCRRRFALDFVERHARGCLDERLDVAIRDARRRLDERGDRHRAASNPIRPGLKRQTGPPAPVKKHDPKSNSTGSLFSSFNRMIDDIAKDFNVGLEKLTQTLENEFENYSASGEKEFQALFNFPTEEGLLGAYGCKVLNGPVGVSGTAYVSTRHFCFNNSARSLRIVIPFVTIVKIQKAVEVKQQDRSKEGPVFRAVPLDGRGDCLQLFTNDRRVHSFYSDFFSFGPVHHHVANFQRFFDLVMDTWQGTARSQSDRTEREHSGDHSSPPSSSSTGPHDHSASNEARPPASRRGEGEESDDDDDEEEEVLLNKAASNRVGTASASVSIDQIPASQGESLLPPPLQPTTIGEGAGEGKTEAAGGELPKFTLD